MVVVGGGGLLGSAIRAEVGSRGGRSVHPSVPWGTPGAATAIVGAARAAAATSADGWSLSWCAGLGVAGAAAEDLDTEIATIRAVVDAVLAGDAPVPKAVFFASSAGATYAGSVSPPFTEWSPTTPLGDYGAAKLRAETELARLAAVAPVLLGRIANLYGPGQNLAKNQGLVSRLCLSNTRQQPIGVYVSLDTLRDYLFVDDCAELVCDAMQRLEETWAGAGAAPVVKIFASQQAVSIAHLLGECRRVFGRRVLVRMASSSLANQQARDLRLRSVVWPELDRRQLTTLAHGIHATSEQVRRTIAEGRGG
ncbi:NAD-dependent epimerase/dehydratase family protein [Cellulomonas rhizosphaerae]|uniref:NAD-dependent epimerase/dehydratase family protein n=1 Tax=Cellulomonas rhizosphaerae TaxID=2293719 RepID=A0A413RJQ6_9CELL|nr:NAD-dependent epimerase/dehydratase family protein [Cellulomonas rhizosphaerae]